ncbi:Angiopoietin-1 receptor [Holothuria leucospilota]|uniref:Angiopoietin-1 receptor n=1 Tax=Holothuria leucospilota TaxID=206669 RepID=A0A9Q1C966_HOLLE|nr:Angiopoietin-1 receptor [Holothuria leucospilota]
MWGPPDCEGVCDSCYNGGICDEGTGNCICPPGFMGQHCLTGFDLLNLFPCTACGGNRYGHFCEKKCSSSDMPERCGGILFCLVHPFGCRCNTGWKGLNCSTGELAGVAILIPMEPAACRPVTVFQANVTGTPGCVKGQTPDVNLDGLVITVKNVPTITLALTAVKDATAIKNIVTEKRDCVMADAYPNG